MNVQKIDDTHVSVTATEKQWAQLFKVIEWVITEGGAMDDVTSMLEPDEIPIILNEWRKITIDAIGQ